MSKQMRARYERAPPQGGENPAIAVPQSKVDMRIRSRSATVPRAFRKEYDDAWHCVIAHLEETEGDARHKERLKYALYVGLLIPASRGRRGPLGDLAVVFDEWMTTFCNRKVLSREILTEVLPNFLLMRLTRLVVKFKQEKTYEVQGDQERDDEQK